MTVDMCREYDISICSKCLPPAARNVEFWNRCAKENPKRKGSRNADLDTRLQVFKFGRPNSQLPRRATVHAGKEPPETDFVLFRNVNCLFFFFFALFRHVNCHVLRGELLLAIVCKQRGTPRIFLQKTPCKVFVKELLPRSDRSLCVGGWFDVITVQNTYFMLKCNYERARPFFVSIEYFRN